MVSFIHETTSKLSHAAYLRHNKLSLESNECAKCSNDQPKLTHLQLETSNSEPPPTTTPAEEETSEGSANSNNNSNNNNNSNQEGGQGQQQARPSQAFPTPFKPAQATRVVG
jgi:hypothetical protein